MCVRCAGPAHAWGQASVPRMALCVCLGHLHSASLHVSVFLVYWCLLSPFIVLIATVFIHFKTCLHFIKKTILEKFRVRKLQGFPGGAVVENLPANAGDTGSSPGLGRSHMPRSN